MQYRFSNNSTVIGSPVLNGSDLWKHGYASVFGAGFCGMPDGMDLIMTSP